MSDIQQQNNNIKIIEGDSFYKLDELKPESVDCAFISPQPPMTENEISNLVNVINKSWRVIKESGCLLVHIADWHDHYTGSLMRIPERFTDSMARSGYHRWILRSDLIWYRPISQSEALESREDCNRFMRSYDHIFYFVKNRFIAYFDSNSPDALKSVFIMPLLPTPGREFPPSLVQSLLEVVCPKSDSTVLDFYCGGGTTGIAALRLGHKFIGIEIDPTMIPKTMSNLVESLKMMSQQ